MSEEHWETPCPKREDKLHCECWYDGEKCCACGDPEMSDEEREEKGMEPKGAS